MEDREGLFAEATRLWKRAFRLQRDGELEKAAELYRRSLAVYPTAEAYTFLGWVLSFEGRVEESIDCCHKAIQVDPDFGNPYNDIGCYLMQQGDLQSAIPWLEKAKRAPRYDPRQFPCMNLGRIYLKLGRWDEARCEFEMAVRLAPQDLEARKALFGLIARFN